VFTAPGRCGGAAHRLHRPVEFATGSTRRWQSLPGRCASTKPALPLATPCRSVNFRAGDHHQRTPTRASTGSIFVGTPTARNRRFRQWYKRKPRQRKHPAGPRPARAGTGRNGFDAKLQWRGEIEPRWRGAAISRHRRPARFTRLRRRHPASGAKPPCARRSGWQQAAAPCLSNEDLGPLGGQAGPKTLASPPNQAAARSLALKGLDYRLGGLLLSPGLAKGDRGQRGPRTMASPIHRRKIAPTSTRIPWSAACRCTEPQHRTLSAAVTSVQLRIEVLRTGRRASRTSSPASPTAAQRQRRPASAPPTAKNRLRRPKVDAECRPTAHHHRPDPLDGPNVLDLLPHRHRPGRVERLPTPVMALQPLLACPFEPAIEGPRG